MPIQMGEKPHKALCLDKNLEAIKAVKGGNAVSSRHEPHNSLSDLNLSSSNTDTYEQ